MSHEVDYRTIVAERLGAVTVIRLNRAHVLNAYDEAMCRELRACIEAIGVDPTTRCLVVTGVGRGFCAGGDISPRDDDERPHGAVGHGRELRAGFHTVIRALDLLDTPTVALINGAAVAGGLALALSCDIRIAARSAVLGDTSGRVGLLPDEGGAWLFQRVLGIAAASRMVLLSETYDAARSAELGLVHEVVDDDELLDHGLKIAAQLARGAPLAQRAAKQLLKAAHHQTLDEALRAAEIAVDRVNDSADVHEGIAALRAKRPPNFEGR